MRTGSAQRYTIADIRALHPCYDDTQLQAAFGRASQLTLRQILRKRKVPPEDRLWVAWRLLTPPQRVAAVERIVTRAVQQHAVPCAETRAWAERWLAGTDRSRKAAEAAAAAGAAAEAAAGEAAAGEAAAGEAWAWAAAWAAAGAAAGAAEYTKQIADIEQVLSEGTR